MRTLQRRKRSGSPRNAKERREEKLSESIYKKRVFWPDRLIPLTEEEKEYEKGCALTLRFMLSKLDEISPLGH